MAHYEANIGMTAPALHKGIASTAGGRKPQGLFLGNIPVGLNRRGHAIGHSSCSCIRSWVAEPKVAGRWSPTSRVGEAWLELKADLISYRRCWAGMVNCSSDKPRTAQLNRRPREQYAYEDLS